MQYRYRGVQYNAAPQTLPVEDIAIGKYRGSANSLHRTTHVSEAHQPAGYALKYRGVLM
jgi:hypothetical protein